MVAAIKSKAVYKSSLASSDRDEPFTTLSLRNSLPASARGWIYFHYLDLHSTLIPLLYHFTLYAIITSGLSHPPTSLWLLF